MKMKIHVTKAYVLSISPERQQTLKQNFQNYKLPTVTVVTGFTKSDIDRNKEVWIKHGILHPSAIDTKIITPNQLAASISMLKVFDLVARGTDDWAYIFEDDARVVNCPVDCDLTTFYNVPHDAEFINLGRGGNRMYKPIQASYRDTCAGGLTHAMLVSKTGARKVIEALSPIYQVFDIAVHRAARSWKPKVSQYQTEYCIKRDKGACSAIGVPYEKLEPAVNMYECSSRIFEQTSNPTPPTSEKYAVAPLNWIKTKPQVF